MSPGSSPAADPGPSPSADGLAAGIARLRRALRRGARVADPDNTLAVAQLELLTALAEHPGARPGELARLLNMRPNTATTRHSSRWSPRCAWAAGLPGDCSRPR